VATAHRLAPGGARSRRVLVHHEQQLQQSRPSRRSARRRRSLGRGQATRTPHRPVPLRNRRPIFRRELVKHHDGILIVDFGSQYTQLIARRVREQRVYCEIHPPSRTIDWIREWRPKGIILSGGPNSVYGEGVPTAHPDLLELGVPVLGLCYGMQLMAHLSGGKVVAADRREYGRADARIIGGGLFIGFTPGATTPVWMSHGDHVDEVPPGWRVTASSENSPIAAMEHQSKPLHAVQFHPEVAHTPRGGDIIANFLFGVCGCEPDWTSEHFVNSEVERIRELVGPS